MNDPKRAEIKARIAAAQARDEAGTPFSDAAEATGEAAAAAAIGSTGGKVTQFIKAHPVVTIAGAVTVGVLVAGLFRGPRQAAVRTAASTGAKAVSLASLASEMAVSFAAQLRKDAELARRHGAETLEDLSDDLGDNARTIKREAEYQVGTAADKARVASRDIGKSLARRLRK